MSTGGNKIIIASFTLALLIVSSSLSASISVDEEEVVFRYVSPDARQVYVVGDFNNWNPTIDRMIRRDGYFEVRLYLLPGRYRYRFIVDSTELSDPDNPWRDDEGNTFFIFRETRDGFEIVFEGTLSRGVYEEKEEYDLSVSSFGGSSEDESFFRIVPGLEAVIGESLRASISAGIGMDSGREDEVASYPLSARASFTKGVLTLDAFSRTEVDVTSDRMSILARRGPYGHSSWLFRRGASVTLMSRSGIRGSLVYSDRLTGGVPGDQPEGYVHRLEGVETAVSRYPVDSDMTGVVLGFSGKSVSMEYVYRHDEGRGRVVRNIAGSPGDTLIDGTERADIHGIAVSVRRKKLVLDAGYAEARTWIDPFEDGDNVSGGASAERTVEWDSGRRIETGLTFDRESVTPSARWSRESIKGPVVDRSGSGERIHDRISVSLGSKKGAFLFEGRYSEDDYYGGVCYKFSNNHHNIWLDESVIRPADLFFAGSHGLREIHLSLTHGEEEGREPLILPSGLIDFSFMMDKDDQDIQRIETRLAKAYRIKERFTVHIDLRHILYRHPEWEGKDSFLDLWTGVSARLGPGSLIIAGIGKAPFGFDRWIHTFTSRGRDRYIVEAVPEVDGGQPTESLDWLKDAESALSDDWTLSLQAVVSF